VALNTTHLVVAGSFPVVIIGLHEVTGNTCLGFVGKAVGDEIEPKVADYGDDTEGDEKALSASYEITNPHAVLPWS